MTDDFDSATATHCRRFLPETVDRVQRAPAPWASAPRPSPRPWQGVHGRDRRRQTIRRRAQVTGAAAVRHGGHAGLQPGGQDSPAGSSRGVRRRVRRRRSASRNARSGAVMPFAAGGVIGTPTYFPLPRRLGLAGEAGPEAIVPLTRGSDGRLGIAMSGAGRRQCHRADCHPRSRQLPALGSLHHRPDRARGRARPTRIFEP